MKQTSTEAIRNVLWRVYPDLRHIWLVDRGYELPDFNDVESVVEASGISELDLDDCDDYALQTHAYVRLRHPKWAFGETIGYMGPLNEVHAMNLAVCAQGAYFYDAKENKFYKLNQNETDFKPFFVRM